MGNGQAVVTRAGRVALAVATLAAALLAAGAQTDIGSSDAVYPLLFPVAGENNWTDTFGAPRSGGRTHEGTDIFADKGTPVVAAADGTVTKIAIGERAGRYIKITHDDGWSTYYMHLNNDTPGTDDGLSDEAASGIAVGVRVSAGDVIDYVGDSGNAEDTPSHLHFELHTPDGTAINPAPNLASAVVGHRLDAPSFGVPNLSPVVAKPAYQADGTELVGHLDPGGGFNAGLMVYDDVAYMGTWGRPTACPNSGVRIIDVSDPVTPSLLGVLAGADEFPETSTDSVWVGTVDTAAFAGDVAVVAVRLCDTSERNRRRSGFRGLAVYDVTDPEQPRLLSTLDSGEFTQGVHDIVGAVRPDGTVVVAVTVMQSYLHTDGELGDWRLIDISDPTDPKQIADWDYRATLSADDPGLADIDLHTHSTTLADDGSSAWVAVWDAGLILLDLATPDEPTIAAHVPIGDGEDGNVHSIAYDPETGLLIRNDEDLQWQPEDEAGGAWGAQTVYDASDLSAVSSLATYAPELSDLSDGVPVAPGYHSVHQLVLDGGLEFVSSYSDGLRIVDVSDPATPTEIASFVPPAVPDPQHHFLGQGRGADFAMVWGVDVVDGLVYLSDMHTGLWIVEMATEDEVAVDLFHPVSP